MARARSPNRDKAFELWKNSNGKMLLKDIAEQLGVSDSQVRKWKNQDEWDSKLKGNVTEKKSNVTNKKNDDKKHSSSNKKEVKEPVVESDDLTDKQRLFCMYYVKYFNATKAYQKAYECDYFTANANGSRLLAKDSIRREIERMKKELASGILLDASTVLQKYIDIAFADITDFVTFGKREQTVIGIYGPLKDEKGKPVMEEVNYVDFKESSQIDGTIITEAKQGKDGISIKLADKMKALDFLSKYMDLLSDNDRKRLQEEKLKAEIEKTKAETKTEGKTDNQTIIITGEDEMRKVLAAKKASENNGDE